MLRQLPSKIVVFLGKKAQQQHKNSSFSRDFHDIFSSMAQLFVLEKNVRTNFFLLLLSR